MSLYNDFLKELGIKVDNIDEELFIMILQDSRFSRFFENPSNAVELLDDLIINIKDTSFIKELNTIKHTFNLFHIESLIKKLFDSYRNNEISEEEFKKKIDRIFQNSEDPIYVISTLVCVLISKFDFPEIGNIDYLEIFKQYIAQIENIFISLGRIENSYRFRTEVIDFLYNAREEYFMRFEQDLLEDTKWLQKEVDILNEWEDQFIKDDFPDSISVQPSELGLIDITKLKLDGNKEEK